MTFGFDYMDINYTVRDSIEKYPYDLMPLDRLFQYLFLCKDKSIWQNENEYRMVIGNTAKSSNMVQHTENGYLLNLQLNSIKSITFGYKMKDRTELMAIAKAKNIPMYEATPNIVTSTITQWGVTIKPL